MYIGYCLYWSSKYAKQVDLSGSGLLMLVSDELAEDGEGEWVLNVGATV